MIPSSLRKSIKLRTQLIRYPIGLSSQNKNPQDNEKPSDCKEELNDVIKFMLTFIIEIIPTDEQIRIMPDSISKKILTNIKENIRRHDKSNTHDIVNSIMKNPRILIKDTGIVQIDNFVSTGKKVKAVEYNKPQMIENDLKIEDLEDGSQQNGGGLDIFFYKMLCLFLMATCVASFQAYNISSLLNMPKDLKTVINTRYNEECSKTNSCKAVEHNQNLHILSSEFRKVATDFLLTFLNTNGHCVFNSYFVVGDIKNIEYKFENRIKKELARPLPPSGNTDPDYHSLEGRSDMTYNTLTMTEVQNKEMLPTLRNAGRDLYIRYTTLSSDDYLFGFAKRVLQPTLPDMVSFIVSFNKYDNEKQRYSMGHVVTAFVRKINNEYKVAIIDMNNIDALVYMVSGVAVDYGISPLLRYEKGFFTDDEKRSINIDLVNIKEESSIIKQQSKYGSQYGTKDFDIFPFAVECSDPVFETVYNSFATSVEEKRDINANSDKVRLKFELSKNNRAVSDIHTTLPIFTMNYTNILKLRKQLYAINTNVKIDKLLTQITRYLHSNEPNAELQQKLEEQAEKEKVNAQKMAQRKKNRNERKSKKKPCDALHEHCPSYSDKSSGGKKANIRNKTKRIKHNKRYII